jgi:CheY-like chemotaxis protein
LLFEVRDDGVGIPVEEQARIFDAFQQAGTEASRRQGFGLGLDISRRLVDAMGGRLQVESRPGRGSRFFFSLPLERSEGPAPAASPSSEVDSDLGGMKVLLAEDDEANRKLTELMLRKIGCQVAAVGDGQAALAALRRERFDLVLLDIQMPVMDGSEAARQAREMAWRGEIAALPPIVAMTANTGYADEETRRRAGMDGALIKPFQSAELQRVLRQWRKGGEPS